MGQGTFGQVAKCKIQRTGALVAVKVIKRQPAFLMQGDKEINILSMVS
jgi:dual specificity protein kinase YAK1